MIYFFFCYMVISMDNAFSSDRIPNIIGTWIGEWVASNSRGYNLGKLLTKDRLSACYVESGIDATAGCADLIRK